MIVDYKDLESIISVVPVAGRYKVYIGCIPVLITHDVDFAEKTRKSICDSVCTTLKARIAEMTANICKRCGKSRPKKRRTSKGLRIMHYDRSLGYQPCDAELMWLMLLNDTKEREL